MANKPKMIVLADIASLKVSCKGFQSVVANLESRYDVITCKFYSYVAKRNRDFNEYIAANSYDTSLPSASRRRNKLDSRQIIDAADIAASGKIDAVALMVGEGDILPVIDLLKGKGIDVIELNVQETKYTYAYTSFFPVPASALREGYTAPATRPAAKKAPKPVQPKQQQPAASENSYLAEARKVIAGNDILARFRRN